MSKTINQIPQTVMDNLLNYSWPGNVRELENVIERAVILSPEHSLKVPELLNVKQANSAEEPPLVSLMAMEKAHIIKVLESVQWKISGENAAAAILEMHPNTLRSRMNKLGIRRAITAS